MPQFPLAPRNAFPLYDPRFEHDACGIGFVAYPDGRPHTDVLPLALRALSNLTHRGGVLADGKTSDGAGILCQLPHAFFAAELEGMGIAPPPPGELAVGQIFLPKAPDALSRSVALIEGVLARPSLGLRLLAWRDVPTHRRVLGPQAEATCPVIRQILVAPAAPLDPVSFERRLYLARRLIEREARAARLDDLYLCSLSSRVIVYKGLLLGDALGKFYTDLLNYNFQTGMAIFHQRYSTNTFPTWPRAQPFRLLCHNGEINTIQGNVNWMRAREANLQSAVWGEAMDALKPVIDETGSDSAMLDNVLELLVQSGRSLPHAIAMLAPEAWEMRPDTPANRPIRDFYAYHASLMEPWDGPAALVFCDGRTVGITLDRNGLRPIRYQQTGSGLLIAGSEAGFIELEANTVCRRGRLGPGQMLVLDTETATLYEDEAIKRKLAAQADYSAWLDKILVPLPRRLLPAEDRGDLNPGLDTGLYRAAFGYTAEELTVILRPMAEQGSEPIASMGDDTPLPPLSRVHRPVHHYLRQRFAQVTNPPIDPLREKAGMSLKIMLGRRENILSEGASRAAQIWLDSPLLRADDLEALQNLSAAANPDFTLLKLYATFPVAGGPHGMQKALRRLAHAAEGAVRRRPHAATLLLLSDRDLDAATAPIPILLAVGAVHHHLIQTGLRSRVSLIVETGEVRDVHHFATLIGYGAEAVHPYLALATAGELARSGKVKGVSPAGAAANFARAMEKGLLKIMSKMGISTVDSYCGAQIFEAVGLGQDVIDLCLRGTPSRLGGVSLTDLARDVLALHRNAFGAGSPHLPSPGLFKYKRDGEHHGFNPDVVKTLHKAIKTGDFALYRHFARLTRHTAAAPRDGLSFRSDRQPIPLEEVEPVEEIIRRFSTAAISHGAIGAEAHRTLAIAMNRLGAMSNSGEGGEAVERYGTESNSAIKQVASGRFGVTPAYLMSAREMQIKMAQGSKPGEGGHLPGHKVTAEIARLRHSTPGVGLISPPPHHDIYSIEDLAQLIYDLKQINPLAAVSVKLVAETGVGTIAAGVVKGGADVVHISGADGGTGASPLSSIRHAGLPFELGLAETQQTLIANDLRDRVRLRVDGGLKTGRDVVIAALLGADEYSFGTAALIAEGCLMARACHRNSCPVGIATQRPELRARFPGKPEMVMAYMTFVAQEVRHILAELGYPTLNDLIGRTDLLVQNGLSPLDLPPLLATPDRKAILPRR
ncbi:MAG: glutamate synthase large subunit, partial [Caldilineae bacterium]